MTPMHSFAERVASQIRQSTPWESTLTLEELLGTPPPEPLAAGPLSVGALLLTTGAEAGCGAG